MNRTICKLTITSLLCLLIGACGSKSVREYHEGSRDNVIDGTSLMVSIDDNLPPIHSFSDPVIAGDTLLILDYRSTGLVCTAYDIYNDTTIGRFGKYGAGPGEVGNMLFRFYNKYDKNLYVGNANRGELSSYYLPEAISDSTYDAVKRIPIDLLQGIHSPYVIDDSTAICTTFTDLSSRYSRLSRFNITTGEITDMDSINPFEGSKVGIAVSVKDDLIFSGDQQHDLIRILSLDGKLRGIVYGPEYDENVEEYDYFFSESEICGNKVASTYTGRNLEIERSVIILTDLDGKYIKTLRFDATIHGMQYHDKTGHLYLTTTGEPQIGYIELDKIPD